MMGYVDTNTLEKQFPSYNTLQLTIIHTNTLQKAGVFCCVCIVATKETKIDLPMEFLQYLEPHNRIASSSPLKYIKMAYTSFFLGIPV